MYPWTSSPSLPNSALAVEDERLLGRVRELHAVNYYAYGYRRMWKTLRRAGPADVRTTGCPVGGAAR